VLQSCKPGAILTFAYINGLEGYVAACVHDELRSAYPNAETNRSVLELKTDEQLPGVFFSHPRKKWSLTQSKKP